jgi:hypothetical protein
VTSILSLSVYSSPSLPAVRCQLQRHLQHQHSIYGLLSFPPPYCILVLSRHSSVNADVFGAANSRRLFLYHLCTTKTIILTAAINTSPPLCISFHLNLPRAALFIPAVLISPAPARHLPTLSSRRFGMNAPVSSERRQRRGSTLRLVAISPPVRFCSLVGSICHLFLAFYLNCKRTHFISYDRFPPYLANIIRLYIELSFLYSIAVVPYRPLCSLRQAQRGVSFPSPFLAMSSNPKAYLFPLRSIVSTLHNAASYFFASLPLSSGHLTPSFYTRAH